MLEIRDKRLEVRGARLEERRVTVVGTLGRASVPVKTTDTVTFDTTDTVTFDTTGAQIVRPYSRYSSRASLQRIHVRALLHVSL